MHKWIHTYIHTYIHAHVRSYRYIHMYIHTSTTLKQKSWRKATIKIIWFNRSKKLQWKLAFLILFQKRIRISKISIQRYIWWDIFITERNVLHTCKNVAESVSFPLRCVWISCHVNWHQHKNTPKRKEQGQSYMVGGGRLGGKWGRMKRNWDKIEIKSEKKKKKKKKKKKVRQIYTNRQK